MKHYLKYIILIAMILLASQLFGQKKVALVLSGGGAQGMAHIGVFKAFEEHNIPIDLIVGSSAGALVGGLYASGVTVDEMEEMVKDGTIEHLFLGRPEKSNLPIWERDEVYLGNLSLGVANRQIVGSPGLLDDKLIWKELFLLTAEADFQANWNFDSLYIPFRAVASDLRKQEPFVFKSGPVAHALRPSMSIPLIYSPIQKNGQVLVDGGVYVKLPVEIALAESPDFIIAVSAEDAPDRSGEVLGLGGMFEEINTRILASGDSSDVRGWDYFFRVPTGGHHVLDFPAGEELMEAGYLAGLNAIKDIEAMLEQRNIAKRPLKSRENYINTLAGKTLELRLVSKDADFETEMIRKKLRIPDSLIYNEQTVDDLINEIYATDIYQAVIPSLERSGQTITLTLLEKPDIRTRGRVGISSTAGMTLFTRTDMPMPRFGGLVRLDATFGNISGGIKFSIYPISYHKTGTHIPFSIRPALEFKTTYHNYNLPGTQPLADRIHSHEMSIHSATIGGWNRQLLMYGGIRNDDAGQLSNATDAFSFSQQITGVMPFIRFVYKEDHIKRDFPFLEGWRLGSQSDWIWQDDILASRHHLWTSVGGDIVLGFAGALSLDYYSTDSSLPLVTMGKVMSPNASREKYYMYLWAEQVFNVSAQLSHAILREDIRGELGLYHSQFNHPIWDGLIPYKDKGLTGFDISINYFTIIGKLSLGWSFYELENYKGSSWTEIGITL